MSKKYKISLSIITAIILGLLCLIIGYFIYQYNLKKNSAEVLIQDNHSINDMNGRKFEFSSKEKEIEFSVINDSDEESMFHIILNNVDVSGNNSTYKLLENGNSKVGTTDLVTSTYLTLSSFINIEPNSTKSFKLIIKNQEKNKIKFKLNVEKASNEDPNFSQVILNNNLINKESKTKVGENSSVNDEGLIMDIDDNGNTFYFRGNVVNNYLEFANKIWRIVKINGDGTVKIILDDVIEKSNIYDEKSNDIIENLNKKSNNKIYTTLENWYQNNLKDYDNYISLSKFCNDLSKENETMSNYNRVNVLNNPTFNCLGRTYSSKIGVLTVDEIIYAGASLSENNTFYYLYNEEIKDSWWTQSAFKNSVEGLYYYEISASGQILSNSTGDVSKNIRPVINLNKDVEVIGEGTKENPYKLK